MSGDLFNFLLATVNPASDIQVKIYSNSVLDIVELYLTLCSEKKAKRLQLGRAGNSLIRSLLICSFALFPQIK